MRDPLEETRLDPRRTLTVVLALLAGLFALGVASPRALATVGVVLAIPVMIMIHEGGHYVTARWSDMKVTEFFLGFGPRLWSKRRGEVEYGVKALFPLGGYVRIVGMHNLEDVDPADEPRTFRSKPYRNRLLVAVAGSVTHFVMAIILLWVIYALLGIPTAEPVIDEIVDDAPAAAAGFEIGDEVTAIDGVAVDEWADVPDLVQPRAGERIAVTIQRGDDLIEIPVTPEARELEGGGTAGFLGVGPTVVDETSGPLTGVRDALGDTAGIAKESVLAVGRFFSPSNLASYGEALTGTEEPAGDSRFLSPVGATQVASQAVEEGLREVLTFLALINIFVGTLNMLPLPPLDGGHVAVATYEKIASAVKGERVQVDMAKILPVAAVVVTVLLFIGLSALWLDIVQPVDVGF